MKEPKGRLTVVGGKIKNQAAASGGPPPSRNGLQKGQEIRRSKKMRESDILAIVSAIEARSDNRPTSPFTWRELEQKFGYTSVSLRAKVPILSAMKIAKSKAEKLAAEGQTEEQIRTQRSDQIRLLRDENRCLKDQVKNLLAREVAVRKWLNDNGQLSLGAILASYKWKTSDTDLADVADAGMKNH